MTRRPLPPSFCPLPRSPTLSLAVALALAGGAAAQTSKIVWTQHEDYAVYTSSGLSRHKGTTPTFSTATWLNSPIMVEVFNVSDSGENMWSYASTSTGLPTFQVAMARHADSFGVRYDACALAVQQRGRDTAPCFHAPTVSSLANPHSPLPPSLVPPPQRLVAAPALKPPSTPPQVGNIDTIAAEAQFVPPSTCQVFAWSSLGGSATPAWSVNVSNCDANLLYDDDRNVDISDDGATAAFSGFLIQGKDYIPQLWVFSAQTGKLRYTKNLGATGAGGPVQLSENGTWVAWTTGDSVMVLDGMTGKVRDTVQMGWNCMAVLSDSGDFLAFAGDDVGKIYKWDETNQQYTLAYSPVPSGATQYYATSAAISSDGSGAAEAELVTFGYITQTALGARVIIYSMVTGAVMTDYTSPVNAQLQTYPTVRMSGNYAGICLWGDNDDVPTAIVLSAKSAKPIFTFVTPGSMFGVDIVHDVGASTPTNDVVYFATAGKHVPANEMGNGGDAYAWRIDVPV